MADIQSQVQLDILWKVELRILFSFSGLLQSFLDLEGKLHVRLSLRI